jgi:hypothetical protein
VIVPVTFVEAAIYVVWRFVSAILRLKLSTRGLQEARAAATIGHRVANFVASAL